jgi:hypothetical protein
LVASAAQHRLDSIVLEAAETGRLCLSRDALRLLTARNLNQRRANARLWRTLGEVERRLEPIGARVAVLKGIATEASWYDDLGDRSCGDLDLWLRPIDLGRVADVVAAIEPERATGTIAGLVDRRQLQHVDVRLNGTAIDLHFDPLKMGIWARSADRLWQGTHEQDTPHGRVRVLRPEHELVMLLLHLNKDRFSHLAGFLDVKRILERATIEWDEVGHIARVEGLEVAVWKSLSAVDEVLRLGLGIGAPGGARGLVWDRMWGRQAWLRGPSGRARAPLVQRYLPLVMTGRRRDRLRAVRREFLPSRQLLEVAGSLQPDQSYTRFVAHRALTSFGSRPV